MKMSLDKTWSECIRMWEYIIKHCDRFPVWELKEIWLDANNYDLTTVYNHCFFCDYAEEHSGWSDPGNCKNCPGCKVDETFNCEGKFNWSGEPEEFYEELLRLNKIRLSKKGKKC